jgi:uncharacterized protein YndB with AHSA1/START domain
MTTDKARKQAVRSRMAKTGESYAAARRHVVKPAPLPPRVAEPEVSDEAVRKATGRDWDGWLRVLDERGITGFSHPATARWLVDEHGISGWWAQSVTVGYERARGLRARHETKDGFSVGVSKTVATDVVRLWDAFTDEDERARWLEPGTLRTRTATPHRTARFDFGDGPSRVVVGFTPRDDGRATVAVQHERLASAAEVEAMRVFWRTHLQALAELLG